MTRERVWSIEEADAALDADLQRLEERLRTERPDFFDETGAFREDAAQRELERHASEQNRETRDEFDAVMRRQDRRTSDAS